MDAFRALLEEKKKAVAADFGGRRYVKQSEVEGVRLKRLRDEEQSELEHKVSIQALLSGKAASCAGLALLFSTARMQECSSDARAR
jgi:hypothetical protein